MTNFDRLKAKIQNMSIEEFLDCCSICPDVSEAHCDKYADCQQCQVDWLRQEILEYPIEKSYCLYANALLSDGKLLFWRTGRNKYKNIYDFYKDFYYADIDVDEYETEHTLSLACKTFEVYNSDDNERIFDTDSVEFYKQYELSSDFKGERPY